MVVRMNCAIVPERRPCRVGALKNANRQSFTSLAERHLTRPTSFERSRSRDEFGTFGTCASGAEFEASAQQALEDVTGAQLSWFFIHGVRYASHWVWRKGTAVRRSGPPQQRNCRGLGAKVFPNMLASHLKLLLRYETG